MTRTLLVVGLIAAGLQQAAPAARKQLIAHRGASAYAPEHTLAAYALAIAQGADFVEQDLAVTSDGVLVCIHDLTLERTTNVEQVFPHRFTHETLPASAAGPTAGAQHWLVSDFTLEEIKRLDAGTWFDPKFAGATVPSFQEAIAAVRGKAGLYPELKDPEFYRRRGVRTDLLLEAALRKNGLVANPKAPAIVQSFDDVTLKQLARDLPQVPRVWLVASKDADALATPEKLHDIASWATGIAPDKAIISAHPELVGLAHAAGLTVTSWTFAAAKTPGASARDEMSRFLYDLGVDAVFTNNPDQFPRR